MPPLNEPSEAVRPWILSAERWPRPLLLTPALRRTLARWVEAAYPYEACGLLLGHLGAQALEVVRVTQARNLELERPWDRFILAPQDWLAAEDAAREDGLEVVGIWHSHPDQPALPGETDLGGAWEGYAYLIVSVGRDGTRDHDRWRAWQLAAGRFLEQRIRGLRKGAPR